MNKMLKLAALALFLTVGMATSLTAQKFGYVNSTAILAELPAVRAAEADLEALQKQLQKRGQDMVQQFQADVAAFEKEIQSGGLSPRDQQTQTAALEKRQQEIGAMEQQMMQDIQEKRNKLLEPIYTSVNEAIEAVAKENGYTFVFDQQVLLYGEESEDLTTAVKAKLGM
ncbi:outer membrane chaperone Skp [Lewinellaceae bacterium SD302]|nr:outer membrane chaperone Skp [Lewinellaceae bacterium SD302]